MMPDWEPGLTLAEGGSSLEEGLPAALPGALLALWQVPTLTHCAAQASGLTLESICDAVLSSL